jgi:nitroimidazol reductase NimA-like FMN-containing flavoprotein (pyridoxamine 5'-phosphate oxidase superfamily)
MRRTDRQIDGAARVDDILQRAMVGHLGLTDAEGVYVVPVSFAHRRTDDDHVTVYLHGAGQGRKILAIRRNPDARICFQAEVWLGAADKTGEVSGLTQWYESVIGFGTARVVTDHDEAQLGLQTIVAKYFPAYAGDVTPAIVAGVTILALDLDELTAKANLPHADAA